jgi:hypothetical protein
VRAKLLAGITALVIATSGAVAVGTRVGATVSPTASTSTAAALSTAPRTTGHVTERHKTALSPFVAAAGTAAGVWKITTTIPSVGKHLRVTLHVISENSSSIILQGPDHTTAVEGKKSLSISRTFQEPTKDWTCSGRLNKRHNRLTVGGLTVVSGKVGGCRGRRLAT